MMNATAVEKSDSQGFQVLLALSGYAGFRVMKSAHSHIMTTTVSENKDSYPKWFDSYVDVLKTFHLAEFSRRGVQKMRKSGEILLNALRHPGEETYVTRKIAKAEERLRLHNEAMGRFQKVFTMYESFFFRIFEFLDLKFCCTNHPNEPVELHFANWVMFDVSQSVTCADDMEEREVNAPLFAMNYDPKGPQEHICDESFVFEGLLSWRDPSFVKPK
jgi:hypothetical protein